MSYVVTIFTEKHLYRVNIEEGTKYTIGSGEKDAFPMSELGVDGQLGICFHAKKQILKLNAKKIPLSVKEMKEEAKLVNICEFPKIEVRFTRDTGEYSESYPIPYECQIHIGRSKKNDIVLNDSYVSRNHLFITSERGKIRIEDLGSKYGTYLNGSPLKKAMLKSGDEIDICDLRIICKENTLYFYNLHETPELKYQKEINHPGMATNIVSMQKGYPVYHRSPRIRESLPVDEVRLSHLPNKPQRFSIRKANFLPLLSSGAMAGASFAMSSFSPAMLAMRAAMMISPVGSLIGNSNKKARKMLMVEEEERFQKYADYIAGEKAHIHAIGKKQKEIIMPQPTKALISNEQKSGIRKGSNRASTGKVGALLLSVYIYSIIASLRFLQLPEYNGSVRRCRTMKEQKYHIYLTEQERSEVIKSLIDLKNTLIRQGKYTDAVDDVLVKLTGAKRKKLKVVYI